MTQIIAIALGGAFGAVMRFLISTGIYAWLGKAFPYGTLAVNIIGSFLIGLMTEALLLQRVAISKEYQVAILVGLFGSLTTFSTFSLDTFKLFDQGLIMKGCLNIMVSVCACLLAVAIGLLSGKALLTHSGGIIRWHHWVIPHSTLIVNFIGAFLIGLLTQALVHRAGLTIEYRAAILIVLLGTFITLSSLYLILHLIEEGYSFKNELPDLLTALGGNTVICIVAVWAGLWAGKQL